MDGPIKDVKATKRIVSMILDSVFSIVLRLFGNGSVVRYLTDSNVSFTDHEFNAMFGGT
jgi:hypothetical protein